MAHPDMLYKIAITQIPKVGAVLAKNLVGFAGGPEAVFKQKKSDLLRIPGVGGTIADSILQRSTFREAEAELRFIEKHQINALFYLDKDYPIRLRRIRDAPIMLYYKGSADLNQARILAVVGTRKPSRYGINQCEKLVDSIKHLDVMVVSGLAYGVDVCAHRTALDSSMPTIGVLGSSLDWIYPAAHHHIAKRMLAKGGLLTEFGQGTKPDRENFPMRNRIIAGLCDALVVIESDIKGGSMISAEMANGYHKDVFAFPGRVGDQYSRGCNHLIKTNRAHLVESGEELAGYLQWHPRESLTAIQPKLFESLDEDEQKVFELLRNAEQTSIDKIYKEIQLSVSQIAAVLLSLEFKGLIKSLPGKMYMVA